MFLTLFVSLVSYSLFLSNTCVLLYRTALTLLFEAIGLKSRTAGDGGEAGYGIPDRGYEDSKAVIKKVSNGGNFGVITPS